MLDQFTPVGPVDITGASAVENVGGGSAMEELQAEMKLLNWHKLANEAALKAALIRTKTLRASDSKQTKQTTNSLQEKAAWMSQVIEEEQRKPLQVSKEFVTKYAATENKREERLQSEVERQIEGLRRLRTQIADREEQRGRKERYKEAAKALNVEKKRMATGQYGASVTEPVVKEKLSKPKSTLATVINSLDKLVELERRITGLENDSLYDRMGDTSAFPAVAQTHATEAVPTVFGDHKSSGKLTNQQHQKSTLTSQKRQTGPLRFNKKHAPMGLNTPSQTVFSVKVANTRNRGRGSGRIGGGGYKVKPIPKAGASLATLKNKGKRTSQQFRGARSQPISSSSTFMTGVPTKSINSSTRGGRNGQEVSLNRRDKLGQDAQISSWLQQKKKGRSDGNRTGGGDKTGGRGGSHLRGYQELRGQMDKRKDELRKNLARGGKSGSSSLPSIRQNHRSSNSTTGSLFTSKSSTGSGRAGRASSLSRSSTGGGGARSSSLSRSTANGKTANNTGTRLPRVGGTGTTTKARRKAW